MSDLPSDSNAKSGAGIAPVAPSPKRGHGRWAWVITALGLLAFGLSNAQEAFYVSNQNTYFLHGLANAGVGGLAEDWLAQQSDPTPVFSAGITLIASTGVTGLFYLLQLALTMVYGGTLLGIAQAVARARNGRRLDAASRLAFLATLSVLHSEWLTDALRPIPHIGAWAARIPEAFTKGFADQYILGPFLQPSVFGVFLLAAIVAAVRGRARIAVLLAVLAAAIHPTYILHAGLITALLMGLVFRAGDRREARLLGAFALVLIAPILAYVLSHFSAGPDAIHAEAQRILVDFRIPHHARPEAFWGPNSRFTCAVLVLGAIAACRHPVLRPVLIAGMALMALGFGAVALTGSRTIALFFPWRLSVWLVPIATAAILGALLSRRSAHWTGSRWPGFILATAALAFMAFAGAHRTDYRIERSKTRYNGTDVGWARAHRAPGQVYLIPPGRGHIRLNAAVPIVVDHKSHPYQDAEVLAWRERLKRAERFYAALSPEAAQRALDAIRELSPVTHILVPTGHPAAKLEGWAQSVRVKRDTILVAAPPE